MIEGTKKGTTRIVLTEHFKERLNRSGFYKEAAAFYSGLVDTDKCASFLYNTIVMKNNLNVHNLQVVN